MDKVEAFFEKVAEILFYITAFIGISFVWMVAWNLVIPHITGAPELSPLQAAALCVLIILATPDFYPKHKKKGK